MNSQTTRAAAQGVFQLAVIRPGEVLQFLVFTYVCFVAASAALNLYSIHRAEMLYRHAGDITRYYHYQDGALVQRLAPPSLRAAFASGDNTLEWEGKVFERYKDSITAYKAVSERQTPAWVTAWMLLLLAAAMVAILVRRFGFINIPWRAARKSDYIILAALLLFALYKHGIVNLVAWGYLMRAFEFGIDNHIRGVITNHAGSLARAPYTPLNMFLAACLSEVTAHLSALGVLRFNYSVVSAFFALVYFVFCAQMAVILRALNPALSKRFWFYFTVFNPMGFYYVFILWHVDILALAFMVQTLLALYLNKERNLFAVALCCVLAVSIAKPQHALFLWVSLFTLFEIRGKRDALEFAKLFALIAAGVALVYGAFALYPFYLESLEGNPQASRLGAVWYALLGGAVQINRPLAFVAIAFLVSLFIAPVKAARAQRLGVCLLALGALTAFFQAAHAYTYGVTILLLPAALIVAALSDHPVKMFVFWALPAATLSGWGTGLVGDMGNIFGGNLFYDLLRQLSATQRKIYVGLIHAMSYSALWALGLVFMYTLKNMTKFADGRRHA